MASHTEKKHRISSEPIFWAPFSAGMMIDALFVPALIVITGFLVPLGLVSEDGLAMIFGSLVGRGAIAILAALTFFHAAHRLRFTLIDLGLKPIAPVLSLLLYGGALAGTAFAFAVALGIGPACAQILGVCAPGP